MKTSTFFGVSEEESSASKTFALEYTVVCTLVVVGVTFTSTTNLTAQPSTTIIAQALLTRRTYLA